MGRPKFPTIVKRGHTIVTIYKTPSNKCDQFTVVHYLGTERQRKTFSDLGLAITEAETVASKLSQGELNVLELRNEDRLSYVRSIAVYLKDLRGRLKRFREKFNGNIGLVTVKLKRSCAT